MDAEGADEDSTLPIRPAKPARRRGARKDPLAGAKPDRLRDKITLNLTITRRARMILYAHEAYYRGTPVGTASALVEHLILEHLRKVRVSDCSAEPGDAHPAESA